MDFTPSRQFGESDWQELEEFCDLIELLFLHLCLPPSACSLGKSWLQQAFEAYEYRGKRLRLSGLLKTEKVEGGVAGPKGRDIGGTALCLWIEGVNETLCPANAQQHALQGTHDWIRRELSVEVPQTGISVALGLLLLGRGQVWLSDVQLEVVDESSPDFG